MKMTTVGIDLAKNVFQVHGVDERGKAVLKKPLKRDQVAPFFANLPPCLIGMEACGSAHHWARKLEAFGHTVRWGDGTRTWLPWRSPTGMPALSGRCSRTTVGTRPVTVRRHEHGFSTAPAASGARGTAGDRRRGKPDGVAVQRQKTSRRTPDCIGHHDVMAR